MLGSTGLQARIRQGLLWLLRESDRGAKAERPLEPERTTEQGGGHMAVVGSIEAPNAEDAPIEPRVLTVVDGVVSAFDFFGV